MGVGVGDAVVVQFGSSRYYTGIVWEITPQRPDYPKIKPILKRLYSTPLVTAHAQRLWEWVADYYMCSIGEVMRLALPSLAKPSATSLAEIDERTITPPMERFIALSEELRSKAALSAYVAKHERRSPRRTAVMDSIAALASERGAADGFVPRRLVNTDATLLTAMRGKSLIVEEMREREQGSNNASHDFLLPTLTEAQQRALHTIKEGHQAGKVALLHGVTGSGKTEIYIHLMAEVLSEGRDVMMLVPEIAITTQLIERLERIFEGRITTYHSQLTPLRRSHNYLRLSTSMGGELIVGVRSALFLPMNRPGIIIVDEEHDPSYKQSDMAPRYNGRDVAVIMGKLYGAKVVLGSATPSLESYLNAISGKYCYAELNERWGEGVLPEVVISDTLRAVKRGERKLHFNFDLLNAINEGLDAGEQTILFQNRRGYAPYIQCRTCGYSPRCPHCNVTLTLHNSGQRMECHYCGYSTENTSICPNCNIQDMKAMGFGTEKVEEEIARIVPEARVTRLDGDTATSERALRSIVSSFERGESDILVGTQIVTKGFDFGGVTTVGILNADNLLSQPNFRASERAYQQIMQVAGRAGRRSKRGRVIIQTSQPQHPVIRYVATGDYHAMARIELAEREAFGYPPYAHLVRLTLHCNDYELLRHTAHYTANLMRRKFGNRVMGPVAASREMLRGNYYAEIALKIESGASMKRARALLQDVLTDVRGNKELRRVTLNIDIDAW